MWRSAQVYNFLSYPQMTLLRDSYANLFSFIFQQHTKQPNMPKYFRHEQLLKISFQFSLSLFSQMTSQSLKSPCSQRPSQPSRAPMWHSSARPPAPATRPWPSLGRKTTRSWTMPRSTTRPICVCRRAREVRRRWRSIRPPCSYVMWSFPARESTSVSFPTTLDHHIPPRPGSLSTVSLRWETGNLFGLFLSMRAIKWQRFQLMVLFIFPVLPSFTKMPMDLSIRAGATARLECAAVGHPSPQIAWQKDGGTDFPAARERRMHVMPEDDVFFIVDVKTEDIGVYSCTAQNTAGAISANATLTVLGEKQHRGIRKSH